MAKPEKLSDDDMMRELGRKQCVIASRLVLEVMGVLATSSVMLRAYGEKGLADMASDSNIKLATGFPGKEHSLLESIDNVIKEDLKKKILEKKD